MKKELNDLDDEFLDKTLDSILNTSKYLSNTIDDFRYFFKPQKKKKFLFRKCCKKNYLDLLNTNFIEKITK